MPALVTVCEELRRSPVGFGSVVCGSGTGLASGLGWGTCQQVSVLLAVMQRSSSTRCRTSLYVQLCIRVTTEESSPSSGSRVCTQRCRVGELKIFISACCPVTNAIISKDVFDRQWEFVCPDRKASLSHASSRTQAGEEASRLDLQRAERVRDGER